MVDKAVTQAQRLSLAARADIQGFITSAYGHLPFSAYLWVEFRDRGKAQAWLKALLPSLTNAVSWRRRPDVPKSKPERTLNVAFTYPGLSALGLSEAALRTFPAEFRDGMASQEHSRILGDTGESDPSQWELGGPQNPVVHALLILNARTRLDLDAWCGEQREVLQNTQGGVVEHESYAQYGSRPENGREHFGFFDGIAQPQIEAVKGKGVATGEFILGYQNEYDFFPVSPVVPLADDPDRILPASANPYHRRAGYRDLGFNGSFVVYRKLAQDVASFWRFLQAESTRLEGRPNPRFMVWLAAKMVGRWPSGAPLILALDGDQPDQRTDDFLYAKADPDGLACPFGSHIRRTNPRDQIGPAGQVESLHMSARHRILRRGKPYGPPLFDPSILASLDQPNALQTILDLQDDGQPRGLHFLCANASIKDQFEFIQQAWVNNPGFSGLVDNRDPLLGDNDPTATTGGMVIPGVEATIRTASLPRFVTVRGGIYTFMPGLTTLRYLADQP
jgi:Dyp-type peroxidase family